MILSIRQQGLAPYLRGYTLGAEAADELERARPVPTGVYPSKT